jgi:hypothetical protein
MSTQLTLRRGNTAQTLVFTGASAEPTVDTDRNLIVIHDGVTPGGHPAAKLTFANSAFNQANAAFNKANTVATDLSANLTLIEGINTTQNTNISGKVSKTGDTMTGTLNVVDLSASGNVTVTGNLTSNYALVTENLTANNAIVSHTLYAGIATQLATPLPNLIAQFTGNTDTYVQVNAQNIDPEGSSDYVATADVGNDTTFYVDLGIQNSQLDFGNIKRLDGYLYVQGNTGQIGGNLVIGTASGTAGQQIRFVSGGLEDDNVIVVLESSTSEFKNNVIVNGTLSGTTITNMQNKTQASFDAANSATSNASAASSYANAAFNHANAAFNAANSIPIVDSYARDTANSAGVYANGAFVQANAAFDKANSSFTINGQTIYLGNTVTLNQLSNGSYNLVLNSDGSLSVPGAISIPTGSDFYFNAPNAGAPNYWGSVNIIWGAGGNSASLVFNKFGAQLSSTEPITLSANNYTLVLTKSGELQFPNGTKQTTAYSGIVFDAANSSGSYANSAFDAANSASNYANGAFAKANAAYDSQNTTGSYANSAYAEANTAYSAASNAYNFATSVNVYAYGAFTQANSAFDAANSAGAYANSAYNQANTATTNAATADSKAVTAGSYANSAYNQANTATTDAATADGKAVTAGNYANSAYNQANTATTDAATADGKAVTAGNYANSAYDQANTANTNAATADSKAVTAGSYANSAFLKANSAYDSQNTTGSYANSAYNQANTATTNAATADSKAVTAGSYANSAFGVANSASVYANGSFIQANAAFDQANAAFLQANTPSHVANSAAVYANGAFAQANAAFNKANTSLQNSGVNSITSGSLSITNTGGTALSVTGNVIFNNDLTVTGNLTISGNVTSFSANDIVINDSIIYLANNNSGNTVDIGLVGHFIQSPTGYQHTGVVRDATDGTWKFFSNVTTEPLTTVNFTGAIYDPILVGEVTADKATINGVNLLPYTQSSFAHANASYNQANTATTNAATADSKAVTAGSYANSAFAAANSAGSYANSAFVKANNALANTSGAIFNGDLKIGSGGKLIVLPVGGDEGGEIFLDKPPNGTLGGGVTIDAYQNKLRIFEQGGTARGVYIDLTQASAGVGTDLLQGSSGSAGSYANSAFGVANSAALYANGAFAQANAAFSKANGAVQTGFTTISANGTNITPTSNADTFTITAATANGINVLNPSSKTIDLGLRTSGVTSGTYGGSTNIPVLVVDGFGRVTSAANVAVSTTINLAGGSGSGSVSGGGTLTVSGGTGITTSVSGSTITVTNSGVTSFNGATGAITFGSANVTNALGYTPSNRAGDAFTGAISSSGSITGSSLTSNTSITVNTNGNITSNTFTTGASVTQVNVDSFATTTFRSAKYEVQMTAGTSYHVIELRVVHDGTTVWLAQYGEIFTGSSLGTFDASITTGVLNLQFTPASATATTVRVIRTAIPV